MLFSIIIWFILYQDKLTLSKCDTLPVEMNLGNIKFDILKLIVDVFILKFI